MGNSKLKHQQGHQRRRRFDAAEYVLQQDRQRLPKYKQIAQFFEPVNFSITQLRDKTEFKWEFKFTNLGRIHTLMVSENRKMQTMVYVFDNVKPIQFQTLPMSDQKEGKPFVINVGCIQLGQTLLFFKKTWPGAQLFCRNLPQASSLLEYDIFFDMDEPLNLSEADVPFDEAKIWPKPANSSESIEFDSHTRVVYTGKFTDRTITGQGTVQHPLQRSKYEGDLVRNKREGFGRFTGMTVLLDTRNPTLTNFTGLIPINGMDRCIYEGKWRNDVPHGFGKLEFGIRFNREGEAIRTIYEGHFKYGVFDGAGCIVQGQSGELVYDFVDRVFKEGKFAQGTFQVSRMRDQLVSTFPKRKAQNQYEYVDNFIVRQLKRNNQLVEGLNWGLNGNRTVQIEVAIMSMDSASEPQFLSKTSLQF